MRYINVKCVNKNCDVFDHVTVMPAGRPVGPTVLEQYGTLECTVCGHDLSVERQK